VSISLVLGGCGVKNGMFVHDHPNFLTGIKV